MKSLPVEFLHQEFTLVEGDLFRDGKKAGWTNALGYRCVNIHGRSYYAHRIIFAMVSGRWPDGEIDHINMNRSDNRPENLREAVRSQNARNRRAYSTNTSGVKGVCWDKLTRKWRPQITVDRKNIYLGEYDDLNLAKFVRECAAAKYYGEFARADKPALRSLQPQPEKP